MAKAGLKLAAALLLLLAAMALKGALLTLPSPPEAPAADRFDAHRAAERLARVLGDDQPGGPSPGRSFGSGLMPHPVDSAANDAVRGRLIAELRAAGLEPRVSDDFACNEFARSRAVACARVRNVVATIPPRNGDDQVALPPAGLRTAGQSVPDHDRPQGGGGGGPRQGRHLLLSAHYDSTFAGPGAGDAGIGVATLLEIAALLRGRELRRPITFLFNEGEEAGLLGARAFVERDPVAARVGALLNFEARGVTGPATMFETSRPNAAAIAHFARAADRPLANSLTTDLYRLIPNSTDVAVFEERDWTILNFAVIGNETRYHSAGDNLAALDRRSLQHMGDQALALALDLAAGEPADAAGERLYADFLGLQIVILPLLFGLILLGVLLVFFALHAWRRRALGRPLAAVVMGLIGSAAVALFGQLILGLVREGDYWRGYPLVTNVAAYASATAACLAALVLIAGTADPARLRVAFWLLFLAGGAAISIIAPGAAIHFLFPPLTAAAGIAAARWRPQAERIGAIAALLLLYLSFGPSLAMFEELMSNGPHWMFAPIGALILMPVLIELRPLIERIPRILVLAGAGDLFLIPWTVVAFTPAYSADRQQLFTIEYVRDAQSGRALWAVNNDGRPVPFDAPWRREELPYSQRQRWVAPAPSLPVAAPELERVETRSTGSGRSIWVRLRMNGAESATLIASPPSSLLAAGTDTFMRRFGARSIDDRLVVRCVGRSCDGAVLHLLVSGRTPVDLTVVGTRSGLPSAAAPLVRARPALARPQYAPDSTIALAGIRL